MRDWQSLSQVKWECKYHIVWVPKYRRNILYGKLRKRAGEIIRKLCLQRDIEIIEGHTMPDHIHTCLSIPPKYSVANAIGFLKGKSAIRLHREFGALVMGKHFWIQGYNVSTVGLNEAQIRNYICDQQNFDKQHYIDPWPFLGALLKPPPMVVACDSKILPCVCKFGLFFEGIFQVKDLLGNLNVKFFKYVTCFSRDLISQMHTLI